MEKIHQLTKRTMEVVGQTVRNTPSIPTVEEMKLRLALEFEELKEKAQAMGLEGSFANMLHKSVNEVIDKIYQVEPKLKEHFVTLPIDNLLAKADTGIVDLVEVFDAALDQRVVASGTDLAFGFQNIIVPGDVAVYTSNMSKFDQDINAAFDGVSAYKSGTHPHKQGEVIDAYVHSVDGYHIIKRSDNHKYLKSLNYSPVDLRSLVGIVEPINVEENERES